MRSLSRVFSRKSVSLLATSILALATLWVPSPTQADSTRTFDSKAFLGSSLTTARWIESSNDGLVIYVAENDASSPSSGHGLYRWNEASSDFVEEIVPDEFDIDSDSSTTNIDFGFTSMSLSNDGEEMLVSNAYGGVSYGDINGWQDIHLKPIYGTDPNSPESFFDSGKALQVALSGDGRYGFVATLDRVNNETVRIYGADLQATSIEWRYFGTGFDGLGGSDLAVNSDGTKLVVTSMVSAAVITLDPTQLGQSTFSPSLNVVPLDLEYATVIATDISGDGQAIVIADMGRQFISVSKDGGSTFLSYDTVAAFGPGSPNFNNGEVGLAVSISADGTKAAVLSGDYVGVLTIASGAWDTVYAGGQYPLDAAFIGSTELAIIAQDGSGDLRYIRTGLASSDSGSVPVKENGGTVPAPTKMFDDSQVVRPAEEILKLVLDGVSAPLAQANNDLYNWTNPGSGWAWSAIDANASAEGAQGIQSGGAIARGADSSTFFRWHETSNDGTTAFTQISKIVTTTGSDTLASGGSPSYPYLGEEVIGPLVRLGDKLFLATAELNVGNNASFSKPIHIYDTVGDAWTDTSAVTVDGTAVAGSWLSLKVLGTDLWAASTSAIFKFNGTSWSKIALPSGLNGAKLDSADFGTGVIAVSGGFFPNKFGYFSKDSGATWTKVEPGVSINKVAAAADGTHLAFFNNYSVSLSTDSGASFTLLATTAASSTGQAGFYADGTAKRLMFQRIQSGDSEGNGGWSKIIDTSVAEAAIVDWDGTFGNSSEPDPTWGTTLWDKSSFYAPNMLWMEYGDGSKICASGLGAGDCPAPADLTSVQQEALSISGDMYLDPCVDTDSTLDTFCIEGLEVAGPSGELQTATLTNSAPTGGLSWSAQSFILNSKPFAIPASGQPSVWDAGAGATHSGTSTTYSVNALVQFSYNIWEGFRYTNYAATVIPVDMIEGTTSEYPDVVATSTGSGVEWTGNIPTCAWNEAIDKSGNGTDDTGLCAEKKSYLDGSKVRLTVRLPKEMAGWYKGRVMDPAITALALDETAAGVARSLSPSEFNSISVSGSPVLELPIVDGASITLAETPIAYRGLAMSLLGNGGQIINDSDAATVKYINAIKNASGVQDQANGQSTMWQFSTMELPFDLCYNQLVASEGDGVIIGMVSTDAMAYSGRKPAIANGELVYSVAGLHKLLDGSVASATYSLSIRADYARCSFDLASDATLAPSAEVVDKGTGVAKTGISIASDSYTSAGNDWWRVDVTGITFSNPRIAVNLVGAASDNSSQNQNTSSGGGATSIVPVTTAPEPVTPPTIPAGESGAVLIGGQPANVTIAPSSTKSSLEIKGTDWSLNISPSTTNDALNAEGELVLNPQLTTDVSGSGFQAGSKASAYLIPSGASQVAALGATQAGLRAMTTGTINLGEISVSSTGTFTANLDLEGVAAGDYVLQINGAAPDGKIRSISIRANIPDTALKGWTKRISETQVKVYVKNVVRAGKVQIFVNGEELAWINAGDESDRKLRFAQGFNYLVRTVNLEPGKNRIEIKVGGERERFVTYTVK